MGFTKHIQLLLFVCAFANQVSAQLRLTDTLNNFCFTDFYALDSNETSSIPGIDMTKNHFRFYSMDSPNWRYLHRQIDSMVKRNDRKLKFYHIGGSHLQADIYTHDIRTFLQTNWKGLRGERGMVFPFDLARTNNPANYEFSSPNYWTAYRSVAQRPETIDYGLMGMALTCRDSVIQISFRHDRTEIRPAFCKLKIFHNKGEFPFSMHFGSGELLVYQVMTNEQKGFTEIEFTDPIDTLDLQFLRNTSEILELEIYGFQFSNEEPGISYTSIGVNGAGLYTYLENKNFEEQLAEYPPDFFAFSVGTNDGNVPYDQFDPEVYKNNLERMIKKVLHVNPKCAILLTVPNDSYYHRKYLNRNIARERDKIVELALAYQIPVWDFYGVMGELGSSKTWMKNGYMQGDMVHFTSTGYHLKGKLYIDAFQKYLDQMSQTKTAKQD